MVNDKKAPLPPIELLEEDTAPKFDRETELFLLGLLHSAHLNMQQVVKVLKFHEGDPEHTVRLNLSYLDSVCEYLGKVTMSLTVEHLKEKGFIVNNVTTH